MASTIPQRYIEALNRHDAKACSMLYAEDAVYLGADGVAYKGRPAILEFYVRALRDRDLRTSVGRVAQTGNILAFEVIVHDRPMGKHGQANALDFCELTADDLIAHKAFFAPKPGAMED